MKKKTASEIDRFKEWIAERGGEILIVTNEYEVVRYRGDGATSIIYTNKKNVMSFVGDANAAWLAFKNGDWAYRVGTRSPKRPLKSTTVRTLLERDGNRCFYCGEDFTTEKPPTKEHLVARTSGGPDHISNLFLACHPCNAEVGHRSAADKIRFRDLKRSGAGTKLLLDLRPHIVASISEDSPHFAALLDRLDFIIHQRASKKEEAPCLTSIPARP